MNEPTFLQLGNGLSFRRDDNGNVIVRLVQDGTDQILWDGAVGPDEFAKLLDLLFPQGLDARGVGELTRARDENARLAGEVDTARAALDAALRERDDAVAAKELAEHDAAAHVTAAEQRVAALEAAQAKES